MKKVIIIGFGAMGSRTVKELNKKPGIDIKAVIDTNPLFQGKYTAEFIKDNREIPIYNSIESVAWHEVDLAIITSASLLKDIEALLFNLIEKKVNILTIAEEMSYPFIVDSATADRLNDSAIENDVTILGTGINPGFIFDLFIITLSTACLEINRIEAKRINNIAEFGATVLDSQGVGLSLEEFEEKVKTKEVVGHIGFPQSINLIAEAMGFELIYLKEEKKPIVSKKKVNLGDRVIDKGEVIGCNHKVVANFKEDIQITFEHPQQIFTENSLETMDEIKIFGRPDLHLKINPEIPGGTGTVAMLVNMVPLILEAEPGLSTILDLPRIPSIFRSEIINK